MKRPGAAGALSEASKKQRLVCSVGVKTVEVQDVGAREEESKEAARQTISVEVREAENSEEREVKIDEERLSEKEPVEEKRAEVRPRPTPLSVEKAIEYLKRAVDAKLKPAMKILLKGDTTPQQRVEVVGSLASWSVSKEHEEIVSLSPKLITYLRMFAETIPEADRRVTDLLTKTALGVATTEFVLENVERARAMKALMTYAITRAGASAFIAEWTKLMKSTKRTLDKTLAEWVEQWSMNGNGKLEWECFFNEHCPQRPFKMKSDLRSTQMTIEQSGEPKAVVETVVVWNGNGARARWADKAELKQVVQATDPDVLCFLEGKTDSENLVKLPLFRDWVSKSQLRQIDCYWSTKDGKKSFGNEGIILFSKVPCTVTYGLGNEELDKQARVMTAEFSDCVMLFTYNPQGGFSKESLAFRTKWEAALLEYIQKVSLEALIKQKKLIWAGDLNVNPTVADWSRRAFDRIKNRIPEGTDPAGCREEDQKVYREMVQRMDGVNVANHFGKHLFRTCFPSEDYLRKNFGQRIDHVIAHKSLLQSESELRITAFDTLIQFGASRRGSSDHCPLWFKLTRGHEEQPAMVIKQAPEAKLDPEILIELTKMMPPAQYVTCAAEEAEEPECFKRMDQESTIEFQQAVEGPLEDEWENIACVAFEDHPYPDASSEEECSDDEWEDAVCSASDQHAFEDCSSPIISCQVYGPTVAESSPAKILVDSGSTLDLVSGRMARRLQSLGHKVIETSSNVRIKVANGRRSMVNQAMSLQLILNDEHTKPVQWLVLEDLPFDMILGSKTCQKWQSVIDWKRNRFTLTPNDKEVEIDWNIYRGQHWRKPVVLLARESITIPPHSQVILSVDNPFTESEGYACKSGLVTPSRDEFILKQKFSIAYMYGEGIDRVVAANATDAPLTIAKGTAVAEFHPRPEECFKSQVPPATVNGNTTPRAPTRSSQAGYNPTVVAFAVREALRKYGDDDKSSLASPQATHASMTALDSRSGDRPATAEDFTNSSDDGSNTELGHVKDRGSKLDSQSTTEQSACNIPAGWEADFDMEPLKSVDIAHLSTERTGDEALKLKQLLWEIKDCLSDGTLNFSGDIKLPHNTTCDIATNVENPTITSTNRSADPEAHKLFAEMTTKALKQGIIEPSRAPWSSNAVLVKKDGKTRMVIDYRSLNKVTVKDSYPMPKVQDLMDLLKGTKWFTGIDCVQAFHQIPMANDRAKDLTTFRGPGGGLFRYRFMPMGLVNAMAIWSRFIDKTMSDYQYDCVLCYADDLLIYTKSESVDDHIRDVRKVVERLRAHGIMIKASKLKLAVKMMPFLGVLITENGIQPNPEKTKAIRELTAPRSLKQLRRILGIFAYYRKFIQKFSERAKPLYELTKKNVNNKRNKGKITLTTAAEAAFEDLKKAITEEPIMLHYPDWTEPFEIHTDASKEAIAAILTQKIDGVERVIMYASKSLNDLERKYQTYEQECYAVVWAAELFRKYIRNKRTVVLTDNAALQWLQTRKEGSRVERWVLRLQEFDLVVKHRKGADSTDVDGLTREPALGENPYGEEQLERLYCKLQKGFKEKAPAKEVLAPEQVLAVSEEKKESDPAPPKAKKAFFDCKEDKEGTSRQVFIEEQRAADSDIMEAIKKRLDEEPEPGVINPYRKTADGLIVYQDGKGRPRVVVPECLRKFVIEQHHNTQLSGHQGRKRTTQQVAQTFFWPGMSKDVKRWVRACLACAKRKTPRPRRAGVREAKQSTYPGETVAIDIWGPFPTSDGGNVWVITMIDHFTKWPVAIAMPNRTSAIVAKAIFDHWICEHGVPACIVSDRGKELISKGIQQLCANLGITKIATAGYNPTGNATVERFHRYLGAALCIICERKALNWDDYLAPVLFSYRASCNDATGFSPFMMEKGREATLPLSAHFPDLHERAEDEVDYVKRITNAMEFAFDRAKRLQAESNDRNAERAPNQYKPDFKEGDFLMVWERSAEEAKLKIDAKSDGKAEVQKVAGHPVGVVPGKLRNPWTGPYKMIRWEGERKCVVLVTNQGAPKEVTYNVNRLFKHHRWDEEHFDTSKLVSGAVPEARAATKKAKPSYAAIASNPPRVGEVIIFPLPVAIGHRSPFGVGRILAVIKNKNLEFQWLGNYYYEYDEPFLMGWKNLSEDLGYYANAKLSATDVQWTGAMTGTCIDTSYVFARGNDLLTKDKKMLTAKAKKAIILELGDRREWSAEPRA